MWIESSFILYILYPLDHYEPTDNIDNKKFVSNQRKGSPLLFRLVRGKKGERFA